jgi:DNA adenine methylase
LNTDWFDDVVLENLDWADVFEKYDSEDTVFYCDPPYVGYEDYYLVNDRPRGARRRARGAGG